MKAWWKLQAARIDALSLRERAFLFVSCIAVCLALADTLWLAPALARQKQAAASLRQQEVELKALREVLQTSMLSNAGNDSRAGARMELSDVNGRLREVNARMAQVPMADATEGLHQVLVQFLKRYDGLTLVRATTLNFDASSGAGAPVAARPAAAASAPLPTLVRTGMELTVAGPYLDLMRYVDTLEKALPGLRWGPMKLKSEAGVPQLSLQVSVVGVRP